jgi:hypothetical protein
MERGHMSLANLRKILEFTTAMLQSLKSNAASSAQS